MRMLAGSKGDFVLYVLWGFFLTPIFSRGVI